MTDVRLSLSGPIRMTYEVPVRWRCTVSLSFTMGGADVVQLTNLCQNGGSGFIPDLAAIHHIWSGSSTLKGGLDNHQ